jgi:hypothetical protein
MRYPFNQHPDLSDVLRGNAQRLALHMGNDGLPVVEAFDGPEDAGQAAVTVTVAGVEPQLIGWYYKAAVDTASSKRLS